MIKKLFAISVLMLACAYAQAQYTYFTSALPHDITNPSVAPSQSGSRIRIDQPTRRIWVWNETSLIWVRIAQGIDEKTGCVAPVGAPTVGQSNFAANTCLVPELYQWTGAAWICLTCSASGATNLTFTGASSPFTLNSSTGSDVTISAGANTTITRVSNNLQIASTASGTVVTNATLSGDGSGVPLSIAQQGAVVPQSLNWTGATWLPSWGNPYVFVTSGATITTAVNEILIGTMSGNSVFGLPTCDATNDMKRFKFVRNGTDNFSVTIDPAGAETFYDGTTKQTSYGKLSIDCTCRFSGGTGTWFFDNF